MEVKLIFYQSDVRDMMHIENTYNLAALSQIERDSTKLAQI